MTTPFRVGDRVRIQDRDPGVHNRTPFYVRGKVGTVVMYCGDFGEPECLAFGESNAPMRELYRVRIPQSDLWTHYSGSPRDQLEIEIFSHWLEPVQ